MSFAFIYHELELDSKYQNNGWSTISDWLKVPVDQSLFNLSGHFDQQHMTMIILLIPPLHNVIKTQNRCQIAMSRNMTSFTVRICVSVTGQEQILTELKSS